MFYWIVCYVTIDDIISVSIQRVPGCINAPLHISLSFRIFVYTATVFVNSHEVILQLLSIICFAVSMKQLFQIAFLLTHFTKFTQHIWVVNKYLFVFVHFVLVLLFTTHNSRNSKFSINLRLTPRHLTHVKHWRLFQCICTIRTNFTIILLFWSKYSYTAGIQEITPTYICKWKFFFFHIPPNINLPRTQAEGHGDEQELFVVKVQYVRTANSM